MPEMTGGLCDRNANELETIGIDWPSLTFGHLGRDRSLCGNPLDKRSFSIGTGWQSDLPSVIELK
jgi:hypothetical protein